MRFLVVGAGSIGRRHMRNLKHLGHTDLIALRRPESRDGEADLAAETGARCVYSWDEAMAEKPDALVVANPTSLHVPAALDAVRAGLHVFMEKPLSHNRDGVDELAGAVREKGVTFYVGFMMRFHPAVKNLKRIVEQEALGRITGARFSFGSYLPDWHPWEDYRGGYSARRDLGGGAVLTLTHEIDMAVHLLGAPSQVSAMAGHQSGLEIDTEDYAEILYRMESGAIASVHIDFCQRAYHRVAEIYGTDGSVFWSWNDHTVRLVRGKDVDVTEEPQGYDLNQMYLDEMADFVACVENGDAKDLGIETAITNLDMALGALRAAGEGRMVELESE